MSAAHLSRLLAPERIAVIGAGPDEASLGGIVLANLASGGFRGVVHPVNPNHTAVHAMQAYPTIGDVPGPVDLAVICTPAGTVPGLVTECGHAGVGGVAVLSAGFRETGAAGAALEEQVAEAAAAFPRMRILGPNCLGFLVPPLGINASFAPGQAAPGHVAFVSQSGALATSMLDWAAEQGLGFSAVITAGNMLDVDVADLIDYLGQDPHTQALILYLEAITDARAFMSAARAFARAKPIVAYKSGRFAQSATAAASHTGAMAGADDVYDAALRRAGIVRVDEIDDLFDAAELLAATRRPRRPRLAIVTNAGGPGVIAADVLLAHGGELAELSPETVARLDASLPPAAPRANPVDVLGDAGAGRYHEALHAVLADRNVEAALVILTPQAMTDAEAVADTVAAAARETQKPVLAAWMGGVSVRAGRARLEEAGVPSFAVPEQAVGAFMHLVAFARNRETLHETPRSVPVSFTSDREEARRVLTGSAPGEGPVLSETRSKELLEAYGIATTVPLAASTAEEAVAAARRIGHPVVLKVRSPDITHKTDVGGVALNVTGDDGVREAFARMMADVAERAPGAVVDGVTVQRMVEGPGHELILGARKDPTFGAVILCGAGGIAAELADDRRLELPPLNESLARHMLEDLRMWPLLQGYRGRPGADIDRLIEVLMRFSYLVADSPEIAEIDINPLVAGPDGAVALDARVVIDEDALRRPGPRFGHLAIRPYPEELISRTQLADGTPVVVRPIRPEDEPAWQAMLAASSEESIRARFRGLVRLGTHQLATRFCYVDYDREMALVADIGEDEPRLIGVARLVAAPTGDDAEYAIFVADPWQNQGLARALTERLLDVARDWGVARVWAETEPDNQRMIAVLRRFGFDIRRRPEDGTVVGTLALGAGGGAATRSAGR